ncbi:hypothetical protein EYF80_030102 [Liparis tanakae]|uniref:Uncharacterized protein n=1 Tax=Liparis tanakae TaxID=230148 RepID=A0A4Z2H2D1_9TELE|nr:hypothetical protein EYF80_030102 [Liparis tanakae]
MTQHPGGRGGGEPGCKSVMSSNVDKRDMRAQAGGRKPVGELSEDKIRHSAAQCVSRCVPCKC